jgi:hypothetical protein
VTTKALIPAMQLYIVIDLITALGKDRITAVLHVSRVKNITRSLKGWKLINNINKFYKTIVCNVNFITC